MPTLIGTQGLKLRRVPVVVAAPPPTSTTWNPAAAGTGTLLAFSNGNLTATLPSNPPSVYQSMKVVAGHSSGLYYAEFTGISVLEAGAGIIGLADSATLPEAVFSTVGTLGHFNTGNQWKSNGSFYASAGAIWASGDRIGFAVNLTAKLMWLRVNGGDWEGDVIANQNPAGNIGGIDLTSYMAGATGPFYLAFTLLRDGDTVTANFGATAFVDTPPTGYGSW